MYICRLKSHKQRQKISFYCSLPSLLWLWIFRLFTIIILLFHLWHQEYTIMYVRIHMFVYSCVQWMNVNWKFSYFCASLCENEMLELKWVECNNYPNDALKFNELFINFVVCTVVINDGLSLLLLDVASFEQNRN